MKKVLNWTVGAFFRTIGRTIAFLVMGGLIYYLLSYNGVGLKDLFFDSVSAATLTTEVEDFSHPYISFSNSSEMSCEWNRCTRTIQSTTDNSIRNYEFVFDNISSDVTRADYIEIPFSISQPLTIESTHTDNIFRCTRYYCSDYNYQSGQDVCMKWSCEATNYTGITQNEQYTSELTSMNFTISMEFTDNTFSYCEINNNMIICPNNKRTPTKFVFQSDFKTLKSTSANLMINRAFNLYRKTNIQGAIENQTQQQQQQHEEMMDSNTTEAEEEASSFFDDFEAPDIGGLSAIVTAPLNTIQSLLNSTCSNLQLPLPYVNKTLTLPCMNSIYTEHFGAFFSIYQTIILAIIAYRCIRSIFFDIHGFTNPSDDRIEVMDL